MKIRMHRVPSRVARYGRTPGTVGARLVGILLTSSVFGQTPESTHNAIKTPATPCDDCHTCKDPTSQAPCPRNCPRDSVQRRAKEFSARRGPSLVILDDLEDLYLPVPFDHKGHAGMAQMTDGCSVCHHYTPEGLEHPECKTCHEVAPLQVDIRKPGLKGAYHRQCMSCHREWSGETTCGACHQPKTGTKKGGNVQSTPTKDDLIGRMHPPIPEPDLEIYRTPWEGDGSTCVFFRHKAHIHDYALRCADCHHEDNCTRCHEEGKEHSQRARTLDEHHKPCMDCHANSPCDACHIEEGKPAPPPFDHARTGWPLSRYHSKTSCRACHRNTPYGRQDANCNSCHSNWTPANFDHVVTGQRLDKNHAALDCDACHKDRRFDRPPTCDTCHEEGEGVTFPAKKPGG